MPSHNYDDVYDDDDDDDDGDYYDDYDEYDDYEDHDDYDDYNLTRVGFLQRNMWERVNHQCPLTSLFLCRYELKLECFSAAASVERIRLVQL